MLFIHFCDDDIIHYVSCNIMLTKIHRTHLQYASDLRTELLATQALLDSRTALFEAEIKSRMGMHGKESDHDTNGKGLTGILSRLLESLWGNQPKDPLITSSSTSLQNAYTEQSNSNHKILNGIL